MNWVKKINFLVFLFLGISLQAEEATETQFVVGTTSGYAPYVSLNEKGEYEGFDVDVAQLISEKLGKKLVLRDLGSMPSLLIALQKKKIHSVIWAVSITEERQKEMAMVYYQGEKVTNVPFIFWKEIPKDIASIADLGKDSRKVICVETGSYQDSILQKYPQLNIRHLDKILDGIMELRYGKCFASLVDYSLLPRLQEQYPELKVLYLPLPSNQQSLGYGICISKSDLDLTTRVERAVNELRLDGKLAALEKKWKLSN